MNNIDLYQLTRYGSFHSVEFTNTVPLPA